MVVVGGVRATQVLVIPETALYKAEEGQAQHSPEASKEVISHHTQRRGHLHAQARIDRPLQRARREHKAGCTSGATSETLATTWDGMSENMDGHSGNPSGRSEKNS